MTTSPPRPPGPASELPPASFGPPPARDARTAAAWAGAAATVSLALLASFLPVPFVVEQPGPVYDTLGEIDGTDLITVTGARTYPTSGSLDLTTVRLTGGPGGSVDLVTVTLAWLHPDRNALPYDLLYPPDTTAEEEESRDTRDMTASQDSATVAALTELGYAVPTTITVVSTAPDSPATGLLLEGDVIQALDGQTTPDLGALREALDAAEAGRTVTVSVLRAGRPVDVATPTSVGEGGVVQLGISVDVDYDEDALPVQVEIEVDRVGGPSAGLLFALGIVDRLTPGSLTGGLSIAGTGTISTTGEVGGIGGVEQKMAAAADAGAAAFLAPASNCDQVVGAEPEGLTVVPVSTLAEARAAVAAVGTGDVEGLPTCDDVLR